MTADCSIPPGRSATGGAEPREAIAVPQQAIVDVLVRKSMTALRETGLRRIVVAGGVGANAKLSREGLSPLNRPGDEEGCTLKRVEVTTPKGFKDAY